jgi:hypothetical protein
MKSAEITLPLVRGVVRKKLEELVLQAMSNPGHVSPNIFEAIQIARENNYNDIVEGFDEVLREVGEIQVRRTLEKGKNRQIRREEKDMQTYFIANEGEKLGIIEQGLQYQGHEVVTKAGRLDISAKDRSENPVTIELKARDYDSKSVFFQLMKYFNETDEGRLIFVAPEVKPDLFFALREHQKNGRIQFFEVEKNRKDYSVRKVTAKDFSQPKKIEWSRRIRKKGDDGLVRVTAEVAKKSKVRSEDGKRNLYEDLNWNNLSDLEKMAVVCGFPLPSTENGYNLQAPEELYDLLEDLKIGSAKTRLSRNPTQREIDFSVETLAKKFPNQIKEGIDLSHKIAADLNRKGGVIDCVSAFIQYLGLFDGTESSGELTRSEDGGSFTVSMTLENRNFLIGVLAAQMDKSYGSVVNSKDFTKFKRLLFKMGKKARDERVKHSLGILVNSMNLGNIASLKRFIEFKGARAHYLAMLDEKLSYIYLADHPNLIKELKHVPNEDSVRDIVRKIRSYDTGKGTVPFRSEDIEDFMTFDNILYGQIVSLIQSFSGEKPSNSEKKSEQIVVSNVEEKPATSHVRLMTISDKSKISSRSYTLRDLTNGKKLSHPSEDMRLAAEYFADEVLNNGNYNALQKERLAKAISQSRWYERELGDQQILNFFGDLRVYATKGEVPSRKDIEELIEKS